MTSNLPASIRRLAQKMYDRPSLIITSSDPFLVYPRYGVLTTLNIDVSVLLDDIHSPDRAGPFSVALACVTSLSITSCSDASPILAGGVLQQLLEFLGSLLRLQQLKVEGFVLPDPSHPPQPLHSPLTVRELTVLDTHGPSLHFLLQSIRPRSLTLKSCQNINTLPTCASLTLEGINACLGFGDVLSRWNGDRLTIRASSFLDECFALGLMQRMRVAGRALWPSVEEVSFEGYPCGVEGRMFELLELRMQL